ncbi:glycosyltransferase family 2 protein [Yunchengibacter salinarum]|uniref:glycosyltransferase family 2 protein n=1 Tax=Yunchengibacter salinarum TaxID=3133399 RepID=UPI0035B6AA6E
MARLYIVSDRHAFVAAPQGGLDGLSVHFAAAALELSPVTDLAPLVHGRNLLPNADFGDGLTNWTLRGGDGDSAGLDAKGWSLAGAHTAYIRQKPGASGARLMSVPTTSQGLPPVVPGDRYRLSALLGLHGRAAVMGVIFLDEAGKPVAEQVLDVPHRALGGAGMGDYQAEWMTATAPDGAAFAQVWFALEDGAPVPGGVTDASVLLVARPFLALDLPHWSLSGWAPFDRAADVAARVRAAGGHIGVIALPGKAAKKPKALRVTDAQGAAIMDSPQDWRPAPYRPLVFRQFDDALIQAHLDLQEKRDGRFHTLTGWVDGHYTGVCHLDCAGATRPTEARLPLPPHWRDGAPHHLVLSDRAGRTLCGGTRLVTGVDTGWFDVLKHTTPPHDAGLAPTARLRHEALLGQLRRVAGGELAPGDLGDLVAGHRALVRGYPYIAPDRALAFPHRAAPEVSVVVPVHNGFNLTYSCLAALLLAPTHTSFEVIVVDDGSTDAVQTLADWVSGITLVRHDTAQGFVGACNAGAARARGAHIVLLNNDTEPGPYWLDHLLAPVLADPDAIGQVAARLIYPHGILQDAGGIVWKDGSPQNAGRFEDAFDPLFDRARDVDYACGAATLVPKAVWAEVGGLSDDFAPAYFEDTDLSFRIRAAGYRVVYAPDAVIVHHEGISNGRDVAEESRFKRFQTVNGPKFAKKWKKALKAYPRRDTSKGTDHAWRQVQALRDRIADTDAD